MMTSLRAGKRMDQAVALAPRRALNAARRRPAQVPGSTEHGQLQAMTGER